MFTYVSIFLIFAVILIAALFTNERRIVRALRKQILKCGVDYEALDQGMTEIIDAYASDVAQYEETIENQKQDLRQLEIEMNKVDTVIDEIEAEVGYINQDVGKLDL